MLIDFLSLRPMAPVDLAFELMGEGAIEWVDDLPLRGMLVFARGQWRIWVRSSERLDGESEIVARHLALWLERKGYLDARERIEQLAFACRELAESGTWSTAMYISDGPKKRNASAY